MSSDLRRVSHGANQSYSVHPHEPHAEAQGRRTEEHALGLPHSHSARYIRRHPSRPSESMSGTQEKMWALFFISLLASTDSTASNAPSRVSPQEEPTNGHHPDPKGAPEGARIVKSVVSSGGDTYQGRAKGWMRRVSALESRFLSFPQASAQAMPTGFPEYDVLDNPLGRGGKLLGREISERAKSFNTYLQENQKEAGEILEASGYVTGMIMGGLRGKVAGPWGVCAGALGGLGLAFAADCGGKGLRERVGRENFDPVVERAIGLATSPVRMAFPHLSETSARMAVSEGAYLAFSFLHLKSIASTISEGMFVVGVEDVLANGLKEGSFQHMGDRPSSGIPTGAASERANAYFSGFLSEFSVEKGSAFDQLLHTVQKRSVESLAQNIDETMQKECKAARQQAQKRTSQTGTDSQTLLPEKAPEMIPDDYPMGRTLLGYGLQSAWALARFTGNNDIANTLANAGPAALEMIDAVHEIATGASAAASAAASGAATGAASAAAGGAASGAAFGPWGALIGGVLALGASLLSGGDDSSEIMLSAFRLMFQYLGELLSQNAQLREEFHQGIEEVKDQIGIVQYYAMLAFLRTTEQTQDLQSVHAYYSESLQQYLSVSFDTLNHKVDSLLLQGRLKACSDIDDYTLCMEKPLETMKEERMLGILGTLENGLRVRPENPVSISIPNSDLNGFWCRDYSAKSVIRNLETLSPKHRLGYLVGLLQNEFKLPIPVRAENLPNVELYLHEGAHYLTLRRAIPSKVHYDDSDTVLKAVMRPGDDVITVENWLRKNTPIVTEKLLSKYTTALEKLHPIFEEALDREVEKTLENALVGIPPSQRIQDTSRLKFSLSDGVDDMIGHVIDLTPLNTAFLPDSPTKTNAWSRAQHEKDYGYPPRLPPAPPMKTPAPLALSELPGASDFKRWIPEEALVAERLALGKIEMTYFQVFHSVFLYVSFRKNDGTELPLIESSVYCVENSPYFRRTAPTSEELMDAVNNPAHVAWIWARAKDLLVRKEYHRQSLPVLRSLISEGIKKMRSSAIASLYAPGTSLAIRWQESLDELKASGILIKSVLTVLGVQEQEIDKIYLWSGDWITEDYPAYIAGVFPKGVFEGPPSTDKNLPTRFSRILALSAQPRENAFTADIRGLLGQFGNYSIAHRAAVLKQKAEPEQVEDAPACDCASSQEVAGLKEEIKELRKDEARREEQHARREQDLSSKMEELLRRLSNLKI